MLSNVFAHSFYLYFRSPDHFKFVLNTRLLHYQIKETQICKHKLINYSQWNSETLKQILNLCSRSLMQNQMCTEQTIILSQLICLYFYTLIRFHLNIIAFLYSIEFFNEFIHLGKPYHFLTLLHFYYPREMPYKPLSSQFPHTLLLSLLSCSLASILSFLYISQFCIFLFKNVYNRLPTIFLKDTQCGVLASFMST